MITKKLTQKQIDKQYPIIGIARVDLHSIGIDTSTLSDVDMAKFAERMCEVYMESFWTDAESIAMDIYKLKQGDM